LTAIVPLIGRFEPPGANLSRDSDPDSDDYAHHRSDPAGRRWIPSRAYGRGAAAGIVAQAALAHVLLPARATASPPAFCLLRRALPVMAIIMVSGNVVQAPTGFDPMRTLTANIALEMAYATEATAPRCSFPD
jgi:phosphate transport system permease protein